MLPINDFNFVVAGIATFAATVGYACTRRLSGTFGDSDSIRNAIRDQSKMDLEHLPQVVDESVLAVGESVDFIPAKVDFETSTAIPTRRSKENLKRKVPHDGFEEPEKPVESNLGYPHNLAHIYPSPNKRFKTPPSANDNASAPVQQTTEIAETAFGVRDPEPIVETPGPEPPRSPSPVAETPFPAPTPPSEVQTTLQPPVSRPLQTTVPALVPAIPRAFGNSSFSGGFAAFAGSTSPFSTTTTTNTCHSPLKPGRSIWSATPSNLTPHQNDEVGKTAEDQDVFKPGAQSMPVLEEAKTSTAAPSPKHTHYTGEEDEDVEMELKGVKMYVRRGDMPYCEGILGHLKLLSHRTSLEERILFRREPLWKVSMNVRVQPAVRCAFVPEENALKFILKENVESPSADSPEVKQELVIYVLKPGRSCSKQDFKDFAVTLSENARFRPAQPLPKSPSTD